MTTYNGKVIVGSDGFAMQASLMFLQDGKIHFTLAGTDDRGKLEISGVAHKQADGSHESYALPICRDDYPESEDLAVVAFERIVFTPKLNLCKVTGNLQQGGLAWTFTGKLSKYNHINLNRKARSIFRKLCCDPDASSGMVNIERAIASEYPSATARDIVFHLYDWDSDALLLLAIKLFPERFTQDEIRRAVGEFLCHVPNHIAAAAKLAGYPVSDAFRTGVIDGDD